MVCRMSEKEFFAAQRLWTLTERLRAPLEPAGPGSGEECHFLLCTPSAISDLHRQPL